MNTLRQEPTDSKALILNLDNLHILPVIAIRKLKITDLR